MIVIILIVIILTLGIFFTRQEKRWLNHGALKRRKHFTINNHNYYLEDVAFENSHKSLHNYYKIVDELSNYDKALEVKYDLYDWTFSIFRFKDTTIELKNLRSLGLVRLIKSSAPISIEDYEKDSSHINIK